LEKQSSMMILTFDIKGEVEVACDRCLENFDLPVSSMQTLIVKFGEETREETDEIFILSRNEQDFDVSQFVYEYIILAIPQVRVHPEGECDPEILRKLEELKPKSDQNIDPRWDALRKFNN
jgi:uncharacterized protein